MSDFIEFLCNLAMGLKRKLENGWCLFGTEMVILCTVFTDYGYKASKFREI